MTRNREKDAFDWHGIFNPASVILVCATGLTVLGITILFSASASLKPDPYYYVKRQVIWLAVAVIAGLVVSRINLERARRWAYWIGLVILVGLVLVRIPGIGVMVNGSRRWLDFGFMRLQVSEFAKLGLVFSLAHFLGANQRHIPTFIRGFVMPCGWIGLFCLLIIIEPDYGTCMLCGAIGITMLIMAGVRLRYLIPSIVIASVLLTVAIMHNPVRLARITSFLDIQGNRAEGAYQLWQSILGFGAGGIHGVGLGNGIQQRAFLPEAATDFIFEVIGEELGLVFTMAVVVTFLTMFIAGIIHLRRAPNLYQFLLVFGAILLVTVQALINLGVVTGCLPTKGMSLPFISYGGSNLMMMGMIIGLVMNTHRNWTQPALRDEERVMKEVVV